MPNPIGLSMHFILSGPDLKEVARLANIVQQCLVGKAGMGSLGIPSDEIALAINVLAGGMDMLRFNDCPSEKPPAMNPILDHKGEN